MTPINSGAPAGVMQPLAADVAAPGWEASPVFDSYAREHEQIRQRITNLIVLVYYLLIVEGAIRKWVAPAYQRELFFIRDPIVLWIYFIASTNGFWPARSLLFWSGLAIALASVQVTVLAHLGSLDSVLTAYGFRNYFLYLPLAFIMGEHLRYRDWRRIVNFTLLVAAPIAILCAIQSRSPADAVVNAGFGNTADSMFIPINIGNLQRAYGPFTAGNVMAEYIGSLFALVLWLLAEPRRAFDKRLIAIGAIACVVLLSVSGHRSAWVTAFLVLLGGIVATASVRGIRAAVPLAAICAFLILLLLLSVKFVFTTQSTELFTRFQGVADDDTSRYSYGLLGEGIAELYRFVDVIPESDWGGEGLGSSGNAADLTGVSVRIAAEDDWSRNIVGLGPILGVAYILYRIGFVTSLVLGAAHATARFGTYLPILLISFIGITLLDGQITGQGSINGYGWLFAGFCLAANAGHLTEAQRSVQEAEPSENLSGLIL